jgi:ParB family chromosome partitioning protein
MAMQDTKKKALGRGLESLIPAARHGSETRATETVPAQPGEAVIEIALEEIEPSPYQPRKRAEKRALEELAASILASGVMQPVIVRRIGAGTERANAHPASNEGERSGQPIHPSPTTDNRGSYSDTQTSNTGSSGAPGAPVIRYQLIAGERRWLASKMAGKATVPALVRAASNEQAVELALIENLQREDLNPMEMAHAFDRLNRDFGLTQEHISQRTGKDRATIGNYMRLLRLPPAVQDALEASQLSFGHAKALLALESREAIATVADEVIAAGYSVRQTEEAVKHLMWDKPPDEAKTGKPPRAVDPNVRAAERQLEEALKLRVKILDRRGKGKVVIEYASLEDFDHLVQMLSR